MEYEAMHATTCAAPTLARFEGRDGDFSPKARLLHTLGMCDAAGGAVCRYALVAHYRVLRRAPLPFDRHDWMVDRCGTEVRYIIDYYSVEGENDVIYSVDARPAGWSGLWDRVRLACTKIIRGQNPL